MVKGNLLSADELHLVRSAAEAIAAGSHGSSCNPSFAPSIGISRSTYGLGSSRSHHASGSGFPPSSSSFSVVHSLGRRLLQHAADGECDHVRDLLSRGAPLTTDWLGTSALHMCALYGHVDIARVLLKAGISKDACTKVDKTSLHFAATEGHDEIVYLLLSSGASVEPRDMLNMTPLHWAVQREHPSVIEWLLRYGAGVNVVDKFLLTPYDIARHLQRHDIIEMLNNYQMYRDENPALRAKADKITEEAVNSIMNVCSAQPSNPISLTKPFVADNHAKQMTISQRSIRTVNPGTDNSNPFTSASPIFISSLNSSTSSPHYVSSTSTVFSASNSHTIQRCRPTNSQSLQAVTVSRNENGAICSIATTCGVTHGTVTSAVAPLTTSQSGAHLRTLRTSASSLTVQQSQHNQSATANLPPTDTAVTASAANIAIVAAPRVDTRKCTRVIKLTHEQFVKLTKSGGQLLTVTSNSSASVPSSCLTSATSSQSCVPTKHTTSDVTVSASSTGLPVKRIKCETPSVVTCQTNSAEIQNNTTLVKSSPEAATEDCQNCARLEKQVETLRKQLAMRDLEIKSLCAD